MEEGSREDETPDTDSSQQLARDVDALLFTSNMSRKSGSEKKWQHISLPLGDAQDGELE